MAPINRFASTRVATRVKSTSSENMFPGRNATVYSKRKAEHSPPKTKTSKRPALNDLTNDGKTAKVKSILKNDKSVNILKDKCVEKTEDAVKLKAVRKVSGIRMPPIRETVSTKSKNETKKTVETSKKPPSKPAVRDTSRLKTQQNPKFVQTKLTSQANIAPRRSIRVRNENDISSRVEPTLEEQVIELSITRSSLRSRESTSKENLEPSILLRKVDLAVHAESGEALIAEKETKPARRSSARLSLRKSLTADKSLESNSLYVSALEDVSTSVKKDIQKSEWYELTEFDQELIHDPHQVSLYAAEIFHYLKAREDHFRISDYMPKLTGISKDMRTILVDWMVEVQENFELNHETLYLSVKIVDAYLDKIDEIKKDKLQLIGVSAMFVACKYDERLSPLLDDFVYVCDGAYEPKDILAMEQRLLDTLKYELSFPISYSFLRRYARCARVPMPLLTLARFILELSLMDYGTVTLSDSKKAAAALYLSFRMVKHSDWTESLVSYTGYKLDDFKDIVFMLNSVLRRKFPEDVHAIKTKYAHEIFFQVSKTRLVSDEELKKNMADHS